MHLYWILLFDFFAIQVYFFVFGLFQEIMLGLKRVGLIAKHFFVLFVKILHASLLLVIFHEEIAEIIDKSLYLIIELHTICIF